MLFAGNRPIDGIDLEGKEVFKINSTPGGSQPDGTQVNVVDRIR